MKIITSLFAVLVGVCFVSAAKAQKKPSGKAQTIPYIEVVDCYKCNELVISLPSPKYPAYVASGPHIYNGRVGVQILIDESGKVETATAIYGHNYFRPMLEKDSLKARFTPKIIDGKATKSQGVIVYQIVSRASVGKVETKIGIVNGRATYLPKPNYPKIAEVACANGQVKIEILIGISGKVLSAKAISGNRLLRASAVRAARQARFSPINDMPPIKMRGYLVYKFPSPDGCKSDK